MFIRPPGALLRLWVNPISKPIVPIPDSSSASHTTSHDETTTTATVDEHVSAHGAHAKAPPLSLEDRQHQARAALAEPTLSKRKTPGPTYPKHLAASMRAQGLAVNALKTIRPGHPVRTRVLRLDDGTEYTASSHLFGGTFGAVSLALSQRGEPCAIKVLRTQFKPGRISAKTSLSTMPDIERELAYMQAYMSPEVHGAKDTAGNVYLFMPLMFASSHDVAKRLQGGPQHRAFVRSALAQLAHSLQSMHADGHVHLDLKPGNAMVREDGRVSLSDFGSATPTRRDWVMPATPIFSAPESFDLAQGSFDDAKADTWSLGMSALAMLHDLRESPFAKAGGFAMFGMLSDFADWRASFMHDGSFDLAAMQRHAASPTAGSDKAQTHEQAQFKDFSTYFHAAARRDARLCKLVLEKLLQPDVSQRASMDEVHQQLRALQPEDSAEEQGARTAVQQLASQNNTFRAVLAALSARQQADEGLESEGDSTPESSARSTDFLLPPQHAPETLNKQNKKTPLALTVLTRIVCLSVRTLDDDKY